jgi:NCAIR mutase (PurE)-related protein
MAAADYKLDFQRHERIGFDEAVYCEGKSIVQLEGILETARAAQRAFLLTRLAEAQWAALPAHLRTEVDHHAVSRTGFFGKPWPSLPHKRIAVVSAGTTDVPVASEAVRTLAFYGHDCEQIFDVGVAGLWRLLERIEEISRCDVVIAVAGMDGALPTVIGGLVPGAVIAVPTSVGYGVADGGRTALHAALASCASGLLAVNIDNGYGAACAAMRILNGRSR